MERINFREIGDLGKILQKSAQFIRQNFVAIMKLSIVVVLVPFIIGAFLTGSSMSSFYSELGSNMEDPSQFMNPFSSFATMIPGYLLMTISFILFYIICVGYIKQYVNGVEVIDQKLILGEIKKHILKVFFGGIIIAILTYIGIFLCLIPGIYLAVVFSHLFIITIVEDKGFGESFSKSFSIIKGKWWDSFLLYFVSTLIVMGISFVMILPMYIFMGVNMFRNIDSANPEAMFDSMGSVGWFMPLYMVIYLITTMVTATIQTANYYNLVESKEGLGEKKDIENIGN